MRKSIVGVAALMALQAGTLFAQDLLGTWQGLMLVSDKPGDTLRVVFKISTSVSGALTGQMYSIDQGGQAAAPDVSLKGSAVRIAMPGIGAVQQQLGLRLEAMKAPTEVIVIDQLAKPSDN